jgi:hypothetical protein
VAELIMRDCGGETCWCGANARTYSTAQGQHLNARPSEAAHMIPLVETLRLAVPFHIAEIRTWNLTDNQFHSRLSTAATAVGTYGDVLLYGAKSGKSRRRIAEAFNALALGIAASAMVPGGIHYGGVHWERSEAP